MKSFSPGPGFAVLGHVCTHKVASLANDTFHVKAGAPHAHRNWLKRFNHVAAHAGMVGAEVVTPVAGFVVVLTGRVAVVVTGRVVVVVLPVPVTGGKVVAPVVVAQEQFP
jgi:hypothetical protein